jgi:hypothetical protein
MKKFLLFLILIFFSLQTEKNDELNFFKEEKEFNLLLLSEKNFSLLKNNS